MARLPTIQDMGPRPVLRPQRGIARVTQAGAMGEEVARLGADVNAIGDQIYEREATAAAKERDTYVSEQIRSLLYDPETGYMGRKGRDAATIRADMDAQLQRLEEEALKGLNKGATEKLEPFLARRLESARLTMDQHAMGARQDWILGASNARVAAAGQDAIFDFSRTEESLATIRTEIREQSRINGWSPEETEVRLRAAESGVYADQIKRMAPIDPVAALDYLGQHRDKLTPNELISLESTLIPQAKRYKGRQAGQAAAMTGVSPEYMAATRQAESGGNNLAKNPNSTALGPYQFLQGTWMDVMQKHPELGLTIDGRTDPAQAERAFRAFTADNAKVLTSNGIVPTGGNLYAAHFLGAGDAVRVLSADSRAMLTDLLSPAVINANPFLANMSVAGFREWSSRKGGRGIAFSESPAGYESLLEIEDPIERAAAFEEYELRMGVAANAAKQQRQALSQSAFEFVLGGGSIADLGLDTQAALGEDEWTSLRAVERNLATGQPILTEPETYVSLMEMGSDPSRRNEFLNENLLKYRHLLDDGDFNRIVQMQADVRAGKGSASAPSVSTIMSVADASLRAVKIEKSKDPESYAQFQSMITRWATANPEAASDPAKLQAEITRQLMPVVIDPRGLGNKQSGVAFQMDVDGDPLDPDDDLTPGDLRDGALRVNGKTISNQMIDDFAQGFEQRYGRAPTVQEFLDAVTGSGLF